jgi:hypothetical protein
MRGFAMQSIADYLIETADRCIRLARAGRELAEGLEALGNELMAKAVELDTARQKIDQSGARDAATE